MSRQILNIKKEKFFKNNLKNLKDKYNITGISLDEKDYKLCFRNYNDEYLILNEIITIDYTVKPVPVTKKEIKFSINTNNKFHSLERPIESSSILHLYRLIEGNSLFFKTLYYDYLEFIKEESSYLKLNFINKTKNNLELYNESYYFIKFILYKVVESETTVYRRTGKDDRHVDSVETFYTIEILDAENEANERFIETLKKHLKLLSTYDSESSYYYGGSNSSSSDKTIDLDTTREVLSRLKEKCISLESSDLDIKNIFDNFNLKVVTKIPEFPIYVGVWYHFVTATKTLIYLIFCNESRKENYNNLEISDVYFWKKNIDGNTNVYDFDKIYKSNKDTINEFVKNCINDTFFEKLVYFNLSCENDSNSILKTSFILEKYGKYFS